MKTISKKKKSCKLIITRASISNEYWNSLIQFQITWKTIFIIIIIITIFFFFAEPKNRNEACSVNRCKKEKTSKKTIKDFGFRCQDC